MKFNLNQKYARWSIRRLSVGVASVVVASGFFLLVGQPNTVHADVLTTTPTEVLQTDSSSLEKNELPETVLKEGVDSTLPENQSAPKEEVTKTKEEQNIAEVTNQKEEAKPVATLDVVSNQAREAAISQSVTTQDEVKKGVEENTKDSVDVPASYLEKANVPGPFLAGVNQVIPYEAFGGDGMLTRLLLKSSDKAPWSDNGTANNPALLPLEGLAKGQYFYEVDLNGNTTGKDGQALLDQLRANGTHSYQATVKVYGAKDGKPDLSNLVATKNVTVDMNGLISKEAVKDSVTKNIKDHIDVPASYLEKANVPGPFLAGVNQVIPYEAFGGDGMLTRLLLKSSDKAPWSDNGTANNPALLPLEGLAKGQYFYEVDLNGNTTGKDGQALLDQLRTNGTHSYQATVKVYGAKDGKADLSNLVATKNVTVDMNGLISKEAVKDSVTKNIKDHIDVPASYLEKANVPGPFLAGVNQVIPYEAFGGDGMLTRLLLKSSDKAPWSDNGTANNPALLPLEGLAKGQYFYEVDLNGNTTGKDGQALLDQLRTNGTHSYQATVKVYGAKDGKADLSNLVATKNVTVDMNGLISKEAVKDSVTKNIKDHIDVPASYLEKANVPGPFLAGVNQVIPYEAFGGDGMLTRLLLKSSDKAPWSDNGTAKNPALLPLEGLAKGQYFYEVDLNGNTTGKDGQALLDQLRTNGTHSYQATVKVYGAKDGKPDLSNLVATKNVTVDMNGLISKEAVKDSVTKNIKDHIDVPASYLEKANVPGPFLAGVNQVIPYEAFGGDGMLTRLLLKSSDKAPWSDNGTANNPALLPLEGLAKGQYFYEVDLNGNTTGKDGQALLDQLRANGTHSYQATVKVYGAKDGKPDLSNLVATKNVTVDMNGLISKEAVKDSVTKNIKDHIDVPASYLEKANVPGPFLAGVNQVIPYEAFGGDGMLTRLLLKSSDKAPWSDNGTANNPALLPLEGLAKGQYFYEVDLNGNTTGKDGQALLDQLRANGTHSYQATVKVYGAKDGKPDLTNLIATRQVTIQLHGKEMATTPSQEGQMNKKPSTTPSQEGQMNKKPSATPSQEGQMNKKLFATDSMSTAKGTKEVDHSMTDVKVERPTSKPMVDTMKKNDKPTLPNTGEAQTATATIGFLGLALAGILSLLGLKAKQED